MRNVSPFPSKKKPKAKRERVRERELMSAVLSANDDKSIYARLIVRTKTMEK